VTVAPAAPTAAALLLLYLPAFALGWTLLLLRCLRLWLSLLRWTLRAGLTLLVRSASFPPIAARLLRLAIAPLL